MEKHHLLRRDPSWDPRACNLCGQVGHQAANCTQGTINWRQLYGDDAFVLKEPIYYSDILAQKKKKIVDFEALAKRAEEYAQAQAAVHGLSYADIAAKAEELNQTDPATLIKPLVVVSAEEEPLPAGWAIAHDAAGKAYYWHKKTQVTTWTRPTDSTPTS
ncbi:MAG: hypothetical protein WDW38_000850 [Sanguina aurantia]